MVGELNFDPLPAHFWARAAPFDVICSMIGEWNGEGAVTDKDRVSSMIVCADDTTADPNSPTKRPWESPRLILETLTQDTEGKSPTPFEYHEIGPPS